MRRPSLRAAAAAALITGAVWSTSAPASADSVPFTDPAVQGSIGFCDQAGHPVTSGSTGDAPFAWRAVADRPAPTGYGAPKGRATLFVYQPIQHVEPGDWSGKQMTASSLFTNAHAPMAQGTTLDPALVDFVSVFKPYWDGLVQVRMFFSAPDSPQQTKTYPAAVLRVKGDNWTLVSGDAHPDCGAGKATSVETINLPKSVFDKATPRSTPGVTPSSSASGHAGGGASAGAAAGSTSVSPSSAGTGPVTPGAEPAAATTHDGGGNGAAYWLLGALVLVAAGGALTWRLRARAR